MSPVRCTHTPGRVETSRSHASFPARETPVEARAASRTTTSGNRSSGVFTDQPTTSCPPPASPSRYGPEVLSAASREPRGSASVAARTCCTYAPGRHVPDCHGIDSDPTGSTHAVVAALAPAASTASSTRARRARTRRSTSTSATAATGTSTAP